MNKISFEKNLLQKTLGLVQDGFEHFIKNCRNILLPLLRGINIT